MPKMRKMPKKPKMTASVDTWRKWDKRASEVKKYNDAITKAQNEKRKISQKYNR